ncbi:putative ATP-binding cassette sub-family g member 2 [Rosellinia necatrix]|uniref:Putative ATP-binding cassette sub-family g member 2 n=1 Tax=Rosellinia necatrix TaxID=77044 RepID=A0A1S8A9G8_ROSNE|nr:putative ATP-binding cassette sub-family g member 2 [Rosellinia necatrix]
MTEMPRRAIAFNVRIMDDADVASRPLVGSSRNMAMGAAASSMPMLTRFLCPPLIMGFPTLPTRELRTWDSSRQSMTESTWTLMSALAHVRDSRIRAECRMFS